MYVEEFVAFDLDSFVTDLTYRRVSRNYHQKYARVELLLSESANSKTLENS